MKNSVFLLIGLLLAAVCSVEAQENGPDTIVWEKVIPELEKIRLLEDRHKELPRWALFKTTQGENREKIDALLNESVEILGISSAGELRQEIADLEAASAAAEAKIADLRERRIAAPDDALFGDTIARIDEETSELRAGIAAREQAIAEKKDQFADELASMGVELTREQVDFLLATVVGDNVIDISIAFYNVKLITGQLESLTGESLESIEIARRYYGMYTVLLKVLDTIYQQALTDIDERYLMEIEEVMGRTRELMKRTRELIRSADQDHKSALEGNIRAQEFALEAAQTYRRYLEQQRKGIELAREKLGKNLLVANNTYETVKISGDLLRVMRASEELFELLFDLQVPDLKPFENGELKREFEKLTTRLRGS